MIETSVRETPVSLKDFRTTALAFLERHAPPRPPMTTEWGTGSDHVGLLDEAPPDEERAELAAARAWRATVFDAGFGWICGPERFGGRGLAPEYERVWRACEARFLTPSKVPFAVSLGMVAPTILAHGSDVVREAYLRRLHRGDIIACQLFSEPGAGSDLASVSTRAERDGDAWLITGQKVWTSGAHYSTIGEVLCRSDTTQPRHRGLTTFVIDMEAPGVEIRPLRQMTGGASFNEVFLTNVRVSDDHRLGDVGMGWTVALTTLMNERSAIGDEARSGVVRLDLLSELLKQRNLASDRQLRQEFADIFIHEAISGWLQQALAAKAATDVPGPEMSLTKMALTLQLQRVSRYLTNVLGPELIADSADWGTYAWSKFVLGVPGIRIGGGTDEVLRTIVGERVLGLPKEP